MGASVASTFPVAPTAVTDPTRPTISGAVSGSSAPSPKTVFPGLTVSRLVPSRSIFRSSCSLLDDEIPITATIVAIPMAIPTAESKTLVGRARSPANPTLTTSRGPSRAGTKPFMRPAPCRPRPQARPEPAPVAAPTPRSPHRA